MFGGREERTRGIDVVDSILTRSSGLRHTGNVDNVVRIDNCSCKGFSVRQIEGLDVNRKIPEPTGVLSTGTNDTGDGKTAMEKLLYGVAPDETGAAGDDCFDERVLTFRLKRFVDIAF